MVDTLDVVIYASQNGISLPLSLAESALQSVDRTSITNEVRSRFVVLPWKPGEDPPVGDRSRWMQLSDQQLKKWDSMSTEERIAYLPRARHLMTRRAQLTPEEAAEALEMPVPQDGIGLACLEAIAQGKATYFIQVDGVLRYWQPFAPHEAGRMFMEPDDESHPYHWKRVSDAHVDREVEQEVDSRVIRAAVAMALSLASKSDGVTVTNPPPVVRMIGHEGLRVNPRP